MVTQQVRDAARVKVIMLAATTVKQLSLSERFKCARHSDLSIGFILTQLIPMTR